MLSLLLTECSGSVLGLAWGVGEKRKGLLGSSRRMYIILLGANPVVPLLTRMVLINSVADAGTSDTEFGWHVWRLPLFLSTQTHKWKSTFAEQPAALLVWAGSFFFFFLKHCGSECNK